MKINRKNYVKLEELKNGDTFVYDDNLYIKTDGREADQMILVVELEFGCSEYFFKETIVAPIKTEIIVAGT